MSSITIYPGRASGVIAAPPSISEALRALIMAAITRRSVYGAGESEAVSAMLGGLKAIGAAFRKQGETITFYSSPASCTAAVDLGDSEETLMLILPLCLAMGGCYTFRQTKMPKLDEILIFLQSHGIEYSVSSNSLYVSGAFKAKEFKLSDTVSADFASGLLMAASLMDGAGVSYDSGDKDYLQLTQDIMGKFGQNSSYNGGYRMASSEVTPIDYCYRVGGDYGIASYYMLAGLFSGSVGITGLISECYQPQKRIVKLLSDNGFGIEERNGAVFAKKSRISSFDVDAQKYKHSVPMLAALLCMSSGRCVIKSAGLPQNNKDEMQSAAAAFFAIGADIEVVGGEMIIYGKKKLFGGASKSYGSAGVAMALSALALCADNAVRIEDADAAEKMCPDFFRKLSALGVLVQ